MHWCTRQGGRRSRRYLSQGVHACRRSVDVENAQGYGERNEPVASRATVLSSLLCELSICSLSPSHGPSSIARALPRLRPEPHRVYFETEILSQTSSGLSGCARSADRPGLKGVFLRRRLVKNSSVPRGLHEMTPLAHPAIHQFQR